MYGTIQIIISLKYCTNNSFDLYLRFLLTDTFTEACEIFIDQRKKSNSFIKVTIH